MYNCKKCPGYCCSYPLIALESATSSGWPSISASRSSRPRRSSRSSGRATSTRSAQGRQDFGRICTFFDTEKRRCTVYEARPSVCRSYPGGRCGYYDFLAFERNAQEDPEFIATTDNK